MAATITAAAPRTAKTTKTAKKAKERYLVFRRAKNWNSDQLHGALGRLIITVDKKATEYRVYREVGGVIRLAKLDGENEIEQYFVDVQRNTCRCKAAYYGLNCKHRDAVKVLFDRKMI